MKLTLDGFHGENRAIHPVLLDPKVGTYSRNQKPGRGDLRPWKSPLTVATIPSGRGTIYRMGRDVASDSQYWLSWTGTVHAVRGFKADDTVERTFYTGNGVPKWTSTDTMGSGSDLPVGPHLWGVPAPTGALTCTTNNDGVSTDADAAFYVYTYVNSHLEESAPSPVSDMNTRKVDDTATLSGFSAPPAGSYDITLIRIYRTQAGSSGTAEFYFLAEIAYNAASYVEPATPTLGEVCPTTTWTPPPGCPQGGGANLTEPVLSYLTPLWNGIMAGISGNSVRFSEAYANYAWPVSYDVIPPDGKPVALGVVGQQLLVLTTGKPLLVAGSGPDSMDQQPLDIPQGCISAASVASMGSGVAWASEDGLCWYGSGGARILTAGIMTREDWQALVPSSIVGANYEGMYFGSYDDGSGRKGFMINPSDPAGIYFLDTGYAVTHFDQLQDQLYVYTGTGVQRWDAGSAMTYTFKSKEFLLPKVSPAFACAKVVADAYPVTFKLYADDVLKHTQTVATETAFRLPGGYHAQRVQIELSGTNAIQGVVMAHSMAELA